MLNVTRISRILWLAVAGLIAAPAAASAGIVRFIPAGLSVCTVPGNVGRRSVRRVAWMTGLVVLVVGVQVALAGSARAASGWTAYVTDYGSGTVTPIDTATHTAGTPITVGSSPAGVAITPDGRTAYVANGAGGTVTPISTATGTAGAPITVGSTPVGVAITPDGRTAYVVNEGSGTVTPVVTATNTAGSPISVGMLPVAVAITPDGRTAYVVNEGNNTVTPVDTATNTAGAPISVGANPVGVAITPDGTTAYVTDLGDGTVTPIDTATNTAGSPITVGASPDGVAITPDGRTAYVVNEGNNTVTPVDTATNTAGAPITVGANPVGVAITPDGTTVYVTDLNAGTLTPIDTATDTAGSPIQAGAGPFGVAITPDQGPTAAFSETAALPGQAASFDGSGSSSPVGAIAGYRWSFGDGQSATTATPTTTHVYANPGSYTARLTVTNTAGTSTAQVFTGQTVSSHGGPQATITHTVTVPGPTTTTTTPPATTTTTTPPATTTTTTPPTTTRTGAPTPTMTATAGPPTRKPTVSGPRPAILSALSVSPRTVKLGGRRMNGWCVAARTRRAHPACAPVITLKVSYRLNTAASVTITLKEKVMGRKLGDGCVAPTNANRTHKRCTRLVTIRGTLSQSGKAGANSLSWNGRIGGRLLGPGSYQLTAGPRGGAPRTVALTIHA